MSKRTNYTDKIVYSKVADVTASNSDNATVRSASFDTDNAISIGVFVDVASLGSNKKLSLGLEDSDDNTNFSAVDNALTNIDVNNEFSSASVHNIGYWGDKRYLRVRVVSRASSPASASRVYFWKTVLHSAPNNLAVE